MSKVMFSVIYMERSLYKKVDMYDIASSSHLSPHHFCRSFKKYYGVSPVEYLRKRRLTVAAKRLLQERENILDVALDLQFGSQQAFTRAFKSYFNKTPARYRRDGISDLSMYFEPFIQVPRDGI